MTSTHFKAVVLTHPGPKPRYEFKALPIPQLRPRDVLVKLSATGVCGTDLVLSSGHLGPTFPILGHEGVGRITQVGSALSNDATIRVGQRAGVSWVRDICGRCTPCLTKDGEPRCEERIHSGRKVDGTFAEYTVVPAGYLIPLPEGPSDESLAPILCAGVTAYKALKICGATAGQWVGISGSGGAVGTMALQYARAMGYRTVAVDAGRQKGEISKANGADVYIDVLEKEDIPAAVASVTQGGVSAALVIAGKASAYHDALNSIAPFGSLVCVGIPPPTENFNFHPLLLIDKGIRLVGSMVGTRGDMQEALEFVVSGRVLPDVQVVEFDQLISILDPTCVNQGSKYIVRMPDAMRTTGRASL
ncbi:chaperonin 10-like protein [Aspergillus cavernicola]|uniref:alcohol dehydrogenase n=1 Tax=Aspergillus cavernicola TaxID=176166 RepID=A0ABR4HKR2_9EURO